MGESATLCIMATDAEIGARLAQAREAKQLTREQLAERVGISIATVQHHENGVRGIRRPVAEEYRKVLRFSLEWLYSGIGDPTDGPGADPNTAELISIMPKLDEARRSQLTEYARFLANQRKTDKS
jgi:transcriptional regulator with XRE-family HTH domain